MKPSLPILRQESTGTVSDKSINDSNSVLDFESYEEEHRKYLLSRDGPISIPYNWNNSLIRSFQIIRSCLLLSQFVRMKKNSNIDRFEWCLDGPIKYFSRDSCFLTSMSLNSKFTWLRISAFVFWRSRRPNGPQSSIPVSAIWGDLKKNTNICSLLKKQIWIIFFIRNIVPKYLTHFFGVVASVSAPQASIRENCRLQDPCRPLRVCCPRPKRLHQRNRWLSTRRGPWRWRLS